MFSSLWSTTYEILPRDKIIVYSLSLVSAVAGAASLYYLIDLKKKVAASSMTPDAKRAVDIVLVVGILFALAAILFPMLLILLQSLKKLPEIFTNLYVLSGAYITCATVLLIAIFYAKSLLDKSVTGSTLLYIVAVLYFIITVGIFAASVLIDKSTWDNIRKAIYGKTVGDRVVDGVLATFRVGGNAVKYGVPAIAGLGYSATAGVASAIGTGLGYGYSAVKATPGAVATVLSPTNISKAAGFGLGSAVYGTALGAKGLVRGTKTTGSAFLQGVSASGNMIANVGKSSYSGFESGFKSGAML
jgi:hypothetical protein